MALVPHDACASSHLSPGPATDHPTMSDQGPMYEYIPTQDGLVRYVRHLPTTWVVRLMPWRDPDQPRFWCLRMELATGPNLVAPTANLDPFYFRLAMSRQELLDTIASLQADPDAWFNDPALERERIWLAEAVRQPVPPPAPAGGTWSALRSRQARTEPDRRG